MTYRFLCGADMEPSTARAAFPGGRFVARACLPPAGGAPPAGVWGILLEVPADGAVAGDAPLRVVTDDGRPFAAVGEAEPHGDPVAVLAAARYWELPPAYVRGLPGWADPGEAGS